MIKKAFQFYYDSYKGFSKEVWWLALVTLINRAGTMVIPFLSLYLTKNEGYTLSQAGWVMTFFGLGSVGGAWIGGKLTDKIGFYPVMLWSLILSGLIFISLQFIHSYALFCAGIFFLMVVADSFRPASFVALHTYSKPENRTRSVSLIRLAINLGFAFGPAAGGLIITQMSYGGLFWIDGLTCIIAGLTFIYLPKREEVKKEENTTEGENIPAYKDKPYLLYLICVTMIGFAFLQYFSTIPLYYRDVHQLSEQQIGWLMGMNGFLIFLLEMPIIKYFESDRFSIFKLLMYSTILFALSFLVLNITPWVGILVIGMLLMTVGEMLNFPFLNAVALRRSNGRNTGSYMALFTIAFSIAHILGHNSGMQLIARFGFDATWYIMACMLLMAAALIFVLQKSLK